MLDFRHETFLTLCKIGHFTKTAQVLHMTQPAVSQHIKYLEELYGGKLFVYKNRTLTLTERGERLRDLALLVYADSGHLRDLLKNESESTRTLRFGATLSIGEFVLPSILKQLLRESPNLHITMPVDNTQVLLKKLREAEIDFALVEGYFDRSKYGYALFSEEEFVAVCSAAHPLAGKTVALSDLLRERVILRESGSGTRDVFEQVLREHNFSVGAFKKVCELGHMSVIKQLVADNLGITFLYRVAAQTEIVDGQFQTLDVEGFPIRREFNFIWLQNSRYEKEHCAWLACFKSMYDAKA